jgi:abequosyltransferase
VKDYNIQILIPTYNRSPSLEKNLNIIKNIIVSEKLQERVSVLISDNNSNDDTYKILRDFSNNFPCELIFFKQLSNIGLEKNAIFLLKKATSSFIMYLGDDDFLPKGYLSRVLECISSDTVGAIVPGISSLDRNGVIQPARYEKYDEKLYAPGFFSVISVSSFGHQLSGIVVKRKKILDKYTYNSSLRNIYPFIFFLSYSNFKYSTYYLPSYKILVSISNNKDWSYDDSGLLLEIFKNYRILYPKSALRRSICCISVMLLQGWRLRPGSKPKVVYGAYKQIVSSAEVDLFVKFCLIPIYCYLYARLFTGFVIRYFVR